MSHVTDGDLHAYLDEALDAYAPAEAARISAHLESCADCAQRLEEERALGERATGILGGADPGVLPLASLEELEARAAATAAPRDRTSKSRVSWRSPYVVGMGWAATIALALWTGYAVKDFAPNPAGRPPLPAELEPRRDRDAVSAGEQPAESAEKADGFRASPVEAEALGPMFSAEAVRGGAAGAGAPPAAVAEVDEDPGFVFAEQRQRRRRSDVGLPERIDAALRKESTPVDRPPAPASTMFDDARANETQGISGTVIDAETGLALVGAQVVVTGTNRGTLTNQDGRYVVSDVQAGQYELRAVVLGFSQQIQSITVSEDRDAVADFNLSASAVQIDGVSVNALAGRPEGLVLTGLADSIGTDQKIRIRGANSVSFSNERLVFIDGVLYDGGITRGIDLDGQDTSRLDDLNPDDIASIEVLKGKEATELYGEDAANGVLLITTKRGFTRVPDLEVQRIDRVELPGMGQATLIVQVLPRGGDFELWSLTASALAAASPSIDLEDRIAQITAYFRNSLPRGWSMAVMEREDGYLVARAPLSQSELDALMERVPEGD